MIRIFDISIEKIYPEHNFHERKAKRKAYFDKYSGKKLVTCIACNGSGRYDHNGSPHCGACQGAGKVREE